MYKNCVKKYHNVVLALCLGGFWLLMGWIAEPVFAHTTSVSTSGTVEMNVMASGNQANIATDDVVVNSTCPLGYTLSIAGPTDNTLYKGGDNTNNASDQTISASSGTVATPASILGNNLGTWGYTTASNATINSNFIGLTNTATTIATKNSASATGGDTVAVYYGASVTATTEPGLYKLAESTAGAGDNVITYYLTTSPNCNSYIIRYNDNGANSATTMGDQTIAASATTVDLWPSNFQRSGYGFAGWNTKANGTGTNYGPMETIDGTALQTLMSQAVVENGYQVIKLYAKWVQSAGNIQSWTGCSSLASGAVTALTDTRDNNTYAVAKLADGKCWMIENLRLNNTNSDNTTGALAQGYDASFVGLANAESTWVNESTASNSLYSTDGSGGTIAITGANQGYRFPRYNNSNISSAVSSMTTPVDANIYSYGNYYTWPAVVADTQYYNTNHMNITTTSICPRGWHIPRGGSSADAATSEFWQLGVSIMGSAPSNNSQYINETSLNGKTASNAIRSFPNNFVFSGDISNSSTILRGSYGFYWSSTLFSNNGAYSMHLTSIDFGPGATNSSKFFGFSARCVASEPYAITFNANGGTGTMTGQTAFADNSIILRSNTFTRSGYTFTGWNTKADGTGTSYADGASVVNLPATNSAATLYAQWACSANYVCYNDNGAGSATTMANQSISSTATTITFRPTNFQRANYGFAGWNTRADGTGTKYGPSETITITAGQYSTVGLEVFAIWIPSAGNLQNWSGCSSLAQGAVTALKDSRDNNVYAVAKLADGKCWLIENLRLSDKKLNSSTTVTLSTSNSNKPLLPLTNEIDQTTGTIISQSNVLSAPITPSSSTPWCNTGDANCTDQSMLAANNTLGTIARQTGTSQNIYSYGNYYNWYSATGGWGVFEENTQNVSMQGDICPRGWHLPRGGTSANAVNSDYWILGTALMGSAPSNNSYYRATDTNAQGKTASQMFRGYPVNLVYSGYANATSITDRGSYGYYWTSTSSASSGYAYRVRINSDTVYAGTNSSFVTSFGLMMRCVTGEQYTIQFNANGGTGTMASQTAYVSGEITLNSNSFSRSGYAFSNWNTKADGTGTSYANGANVINLPITNGVATLYAQWVCPANYVCYSDNGANSSTKMGNQSVSASATTVDLRPSNFQRANYGFAGWNTKADGTGTNYGPMETITITAGQYSTKGLMLYAKWIQSAGDIQNWSGCSSLASGAVTALKDTRDNNVYAVAKLADGNCWMIENLRLNNAASLTASNTDNIASGFTLPASQTPSETAWCTTNNTTCMNAPYLYSGNTASPVSNMTSLNQNVYSYGNYYNWYAATGGRGLRSTSSAATGSICPVGWRLPVGGNKSNSQFFALNTSVNSGATNTSLGLMTYPVNFIYPGYISGTLTNRGSEGRYWSITGYSTAGMTYELDITASKVAFTTPYIYIGFPVRCVKR